MSRNRFTLLLLLGCLWLFVSCGSEDEVCRESTEVKLHIGFYKTGETKVSPIDSIMVVGIQGDSVFYEPTKNLSEIQLPLEFGVGVSQYAIRFNEKWDTLTVLYNSDLYFVSYACGMIYTHTIDTVLIKGQTSKGLSIPYKSVTTENVQHLQIYR